MRTVLVALTLADASRWPELAESASRLGGVAAVLQGEGPGLVDQLDALAATGTKPVHLIGVTFGDDLGPASWVGRVARWWLDSRGPQLELWFSSRPLRGLPEVLPDAGRARLLGPRDSMTNPDWEEPPPVARQVLVCRGVRCSAKGAAATQDALKRALTEAGALDESVLVTVTACCYPCNRAPVVVVQPDMQWLGPVTPDDVPDLVRQLTGATNGQEPAGGGPEPTQPA